MTAGDQPQVEGVDGGAASGLRVVALGGLLVLLLASGAALLGPAEQPLVPSEVLDELFASGEPEPGEVLVPVEARRLPTGERLVRLEPMEAWASGPAEVTIVEYPAERGSEVLKQQIAGLRFRSAEGGQGGGRGGRPGWGSRGGWGEEDRGAALQEKGTFRWHGYEAEFARLRHGDEAGSQAGAKAGPKARPSAPTFESVRVNLSTGGRCVIAYLRYPEEVVPSRGEVAATLGQLQPLD